MMTIAAALIIQAQTLAAVLQDFDGVVSIRSPVKLVKQKAVEKDPGLLNDQMWVGSYKGQGFVVDVQTIADPKPSTAQILSENVKSITTGEFGQVIGMRDLLVDGWSGLQLTLRDEAEGSTLVTKMFRMNDRFVVVTVNYRTATVRPKETEEFLNSVSFAKKGDMVAAGPTLERFSLGKTGLTALFPHKPFELKPVGGVTSFIATYGVRSFAVSFQDYPDEAPDPTETELDDAQRSITREILASVHGVQTKQGSGVVGTGHALTTNFTIEGQGLGKVAVYTIGRRFIALVAVTHKTYLDQKVEDAFFSSVQAAGK